MITVTVTLVETIDEDGVKGHAVQVEREGVTDLVPVRLDEPSIAILEEPEPGNTQSAKQLRKRSQKAERKLASSVGGKAHRGSGALHFLKSDASVKGRFRFEHKFTQAKQYTLTLADLYKLLGECQDEEDPVFVIEFAERGTLRSKAEYAVVPLDTWRKLNGFDSDAG